MTGTMTAGSPRSNDIGRWPVLCAAGRSSTRISPKASRRSRKPRAVSLHLHKLDCRLVAITVGLEILSEKIVPQRGGDIAGIRERNRDFTCLALVPKIRFPIERDTIGRIAVGSQNFRQMHGELTHHGAQRRGVHFVQWTQRPSASSNVVDIACQHADGAEDA